MSGCSKKDFVMHQNVDSNFDFYFRECLNINITPKISQKAMSQNVFQLTSDRSLLDSPSSHYPSTCHQGQAELL